MESSGIKWREVVCIGATLIVLAFLAAMATMVTKDNRENEEYV
jgi:uncharacterized ion transporter superfamily protein YfcC